MNVARMLGATAVAACCWFGVRARAQSATATHFGRTTTAAAAAPAPGRRAVGFRATAAPNRSTDHPLAPYTSRPRAATSGTPIARVPERPPARPVVRNYYPTARVGRQISPAVGVGHHCTPSRASVLGISR